MSKFVIAFPPFCPPPFLIPGGAETKTRHQDCGKLPSADLGDHGDRQRGALLADDGVLVADKQAIAAPFFPAKAAHRLGGPAVAFAAHVIALIFSLGLPC